MAENRTSKRTVLIAVAQIACIVGIVVYVVAIIRLPLRQVPPELDLAFRQAIAVRLKPGNPNDMTIRGREGWVAEDFFSDLDAIRAANAIVAQDRHELQSLIDAGLDVNHAGKADMTLLFWALVADNRPAFELLLDSGADPDKRLSGTIVPQRSARTFARNDTVLFASLKISRADFFLAALKHTDNVNQRDIGKDTFLHACTKGNLFIRVTIGKQVLQPLIDAGIDLNAQDRYGCTAAYYAAAGDAAICLRLLHAGADPEIPSDRGDKLADRLSHALKHYKKQGLTQWIADAERVREWLDSNRKSNTEPE